MLSAEWSSHCALHLSQRDTSSKTRVIADVANGLKGEGPALWSEIWKCISSSSSSPLFSCKLSRAQSQVRQVGSSVLTSPSGFLQPPRHESKHSSWETLSCGLHPYKTNRRNQKISLREWEKWEKREHNEGQIIVPVFVRRQRTCLHFDRQRCSVSPHPDAPCPVRACVCVRVCVCITHSATIS